MANIIVSHSIILVLLGRSIVVKKSINSKVLSTSILKKWYHNSSGSSGISNIDRQKMTSPTAIVNLEDVKEETTRSQHAVIERPSIIKSTTSSITPKPQVIIVPPTTDRPSVICTVQKSVLVNNAIGDLSATVTSNSTVDPAEKLNKEVVNEAPDILEVVKCQTVPQSEPDSKNHSSSTADSESSERNKAYLRIKKHKFVIMLSYSGTGYFGMQKNPGTKTIEDELFKSLLKNGFIDEESYNRPQTVQFQRAARTDKNVSAARQIVSIKLPENITVEKINAFLPSQIRVQGLKRVTKGFDAKHNCDARTYSYMTPTFAFVPMEGIVTESYRITPEVLQEVRDRLNGYVGRKNYHNFTSRKKPGDPSAQRVILSFTCSDPFIQEGLEYVILHVKGQSFMMHQIRKMIGLVIAIIRGFASTDVMEKAFLLDRIDIPRAPGLGLMLDRVHYERYDKKFGADGLHDPLTWVQENNKVEEFCKEHIYSTVTKLENEEKSMFQWMSTLIYHTYDVREHEPMTAEEKKKDKNDNGEPSSESLFGKVHRNIERLNADNTISKSQVEDDDDEGDGDDDDDEDMPKSKKLKKEN